MDEPSIYASRPIIFLLLQAEPHVSTLWLVAVHFFFFFYFFSNTKLLPKPIQSEAKIYFPLGEAFSTVFFCSSFNAPLPSTSDKTAAAAK